ncbi:MAG: septum formation protein Maf [Phycisphaeraceae bacterium]|nr:septum formation protein Maf [Phycisphaeraceae bacterium]
MVVLVKESRLNGVPGQTPPGGERFRALAAPAAAPAPAGRLVLASQSPRRRELLAQRGVRFDIVEPTFDDADLTRGRVDPSAWVASLAYLKATGAIERARREGRDLAGATFLGADTVVVDRGTLLGKPRNAVHAGEMLRALRGHAHEVVTGVALVEAVDGRREILTDRATVWFSYLPDALIDAYCASGAWRGKAGGYNLEEIQRAGWPVRCEGDPTTVMGLPMRLIEPRLVGFVPGTP